MDQPAGKSVFPRRVLIVWWSVLRKSPLPFRPEQTFWNMLTTTVLINEHEYMTTLTSAMKTTTTVTIRSGSTGQQRQKKKKKKQPSNPTSGSGMRTSLKSALGLELSKQIGPTSISSFPELSALLSYMLKKQVRKCLELRLTLCINHKNQALLTCDMCWHSMCWHVLTCGPGQRKGEWLWVWRFRVLHLANAKAILSASLPSPP